MLILAIDTATKTAGAALFKDGCPYGETVINVGMTHSTSLLPIVHSLLEMCRVKVEEIDALAFVNGPGSFTGLRIGGAFITGFAQGRNLPIYSIPTLDALALNGENFTGVIAPILDARKNEVYTASYSSANKEIKKLTTEKALTLENFMTQFPNPSEVLVLGDGVPKYRAILNDAGFNVPSELFITPRPANIAFLAYQKYLNKDKPLTYNEIKLFYLRVPEAEVQLLKRVLNSEGDSTPTEFLELQMNDLIGVGLPLKEEGDLRQVSQLKKQEEAHA